jgi:hypothetical protein
VTGLLEPTLAAKMKRLAKLGEGIITAQLVTVNKKGA